MIHARAFALTCPLFKKEREREGNWVTKGKGQKGEGEREKKGASGVRARAHDCAYNPRSLDQSCRASGAERVLYTYTAYCIAIIAYARARKRDITEREGCVYNCEGV